MLEFIRNAYVSPFEFIFNIVLIAMWAVFMWHTLTPRFSKKVTILIYIPICLLLPVLSKLMPERSFLRMFSVPGLMVISGFVCFKGKPLPTVFCSFFPGLAIVLAEAASLLINPDIYIYSYNSDAVWVTPKAVMTMFFYLPFYALILFFTASQISKTRYSLTVKQWVIFLFFPLSQALTVSFAYNSMFGTTPDTKHLLVFAAFLALCVAADIALIRTIADAGKKAELEVTNRMLEKQLNMQLSHYKAITSQFEANRRIRHDIMHHVNTIQYLLADGKQQEAAEYAGQFLEENRSGSMLGRCENPVVDAFLYGRIEEAKKQGIDVKTDIILPVELPISNTDLVIVFGNIIDNAIEACDKIESPSITLDAKIDGSYLIISEENPAVPKSEDGKQRRIPELERGFGTQILDSVAEKHSGSCMSKTEDGMYSVSVILKLYK